MKNKKQYIILLLLLLLTQAIALIGVWNLKLGIPGAFTITMLSHVLAIITIIILFLLLFEIIKGNYFKKRIHTKPELNTISVSEKSQIQREFSDPKLLAEKIFKNVLLKRNLASFGEKLLQNLANEFDGMQAVFYLYHEKEKLFKPISNYAILSGNDIKSFAPGEGIVGQAAMEEKITALSNLPPKYRNIHSGLGSGEPLFIYFIPFFTDKNCIAIIELSTFKEIQGNRLTTLNFLIMLGAKKLTQFREKINE